MSNYRVIAEVSRVLKKTLWDQFSGDGTIRPIVGNEEAIVFQNPTETARDSANRLSLWLYQVTENEYVKNQPMIRPPNNGTAAAIGNNLQFPPLAVNLFYLLTPFATTGDADHLLLGKSMEVFYDNAIIPLRSDPDLQGSDDDISEELRVIFCRLSLEELTRIWEALQEPYRLSVCYQVRVTRIDSRNSRSVGRVVERGARASN